MICAYYMFMMYTVSYHLCMHVLCVNVYMLHVLHISFASCVKILQFVILLFSRANSRDGRTKKFTNKICRDNHVHYTSLHLLFEYVQETNQTVM